MIYLVNKQNRLNLAASMALENEPSIEKKNSAFPALLRQC